MRNVVNRFRNVKDYLGYSQARGIMQGFGPVGSFVQQAILTLSENLLTVEVLKEIAKIMCSKSFNGDWLGR